MRSSDYAFGQSIQGFTQRKICRDEPSKDVANLQFVRNIYIYTCIPVKQHSIDGFLEVERLVTELLSVLQLEWFEQYSLSHWEGQSQHCRQTATDDESHHHNALYNYRGMAKVLHRCVRLYIICII